MNSHPLSDAWQLFTNQLLELNSFEFSTVSDYDIRGATISDECIDWIRVSWLTYWGCFLSITSLVDQSQKLHRTQSSLTSKPFGYSSFRVLIEKSNQKAIASCKGEFRARLLSRAVSELHVELVTIGRRVGRKGFHVSETIDHENLFSLLSTYLGPSRSLDLFHSESGLWDFVFENSFRASGFLQLANKHVMKLASICALTIK